MKKGIFILVLLFVQLSGYSDSLQEREQYRKIIGEVSASLLITSMHLNEVIFSKVLSGNATKLDLRRVEDSLSALKRHEKRMDHMLKNMYEKPELRKRDEAIKPLIREITASTEALSSFLKTQDLTDKNNYFKHRDAFVMMLKKMAAAATKK